MIGATGNSLKARNLKWLVLLAFLDAVLITGIALPQVQDVGFTNTIIGRALAPGLLPLIVLILINLFPTSFKFRLLYWKGPDGLPGASAFSRLGPADPRVDMSVIERHLKELPVTPSEQNKKWYRLFRQVRTAPAVEQAHQVSLMFRDMVAMSAVLAVVVPLIVWWITGDLHLAGVVFAVLIVQYLTLVANGRAAGERFVSNVLAEHSVLPDSPASKLRSEN